MNQPRMLLINSYGGSLLVAARQLANNPTTRGIKIIGSYEDSGYGLSIQQDNFKGIDFRKTTAEWPKQDLSDAIVFAHPPCKVFSVQAGRARKGVDGSAFNCTTSVMKYSMGQKCMALAIESVPMAEEGARRVHDEYAARYGYVVLRIRQNAATFGIPQWRPRFWVVFVRKDLFKGSWVFCQEYKRKTIGDMVEEVANRIPLSKQTADPKLLEQVAKQEYMLLKEKFKVDVVERLFNGVDRAGNPDYGYLAAIIKREIEYEGDVLQISKRYCAKGKYMCSGMRVLDPTELCSTVLYDAWWMVYGRPLTQEEYKACMGFPIDYKLPANKYREFLSRGVCPPVAKWLMQEVLRNLGGKMIPTRGAIREIRAGEVADFNVNRKEWAKKLRQRELYVNA